MTSLDRPALRARAEQAAKKFIEGATPTEHVGYRIVSIGEVADLIEAALLQLHTDAGQAEPEQEKQGEVIRGIPPFQHPGYVFRRGTPGPWTPDEDDADPEPSPASQEIERQPAGQAEPVDGDIHQRAAALWEAIKPPIDPRATDPKRPERIAKIVVALLAAS